MQVVNLEGRLSSSIFESGLRDYSQLARSSRVDMPRVAAILW